MEKQTPYEIENAGLIRVFSDGSVVRVDEDYTKGPLKDDGSVIWKDYMFDHSLSLQLRIYKPSSIPSHQKVPVYFYFHGGGFCYGSRIWTIFHDYCHHLASTLQVVVIAPDHRLAPENPLPAAIDDAFTAVKWVQSQFLFKDSASPLFDSAAPLLDSADPRCVYMSGNSSGATICHHLAVKLATHEISPLHIRGYVLMTPGFGGVRRTISELLSSLHPFFCIELYDCFWRLALPKGSTRDHPLANPCGPNSEDLSLVKFPPMLVIMAGRDALRDRHLAYVQMLRDKGKNVEMVMFADQRHSFNYFDLNSQANNELMARIMSFIAATSGKAGRSRSLL